MIHGKFLCLGLATLVAAISALPTLRDAPNAEAAKTETKTKLENELDKLSHDGVSVSKSEHVEVKTVDGKAEQAKVEKETISDAKTGKVVADMVKTVTTDEKGEQTKNVKVDVPSIGVHEELKGDDADSFELVEPETVAQYIFETDDIDGIKSAVDSMLDAKKISKKNADSYLDQVRDHLNIIHNQALQEEFEAHMEEQRKEEDQAYKDMLEMTDVLNTRQNTEEALYTYISKLYSLYRLEGDEYARNLISQYTSFVQQETEAGNISERLQDEIFGVVMQALKDVDAELRTGEEKSEEEAKLKEEPSSKNAKAAN